MESARAHLAEKDDRLVSVAPLLELAGDWRLFLNGGVTEEEMEALRKHERTGRPLGKNSFVEQLEQTLNRPLKRLAPGRKRKGESN